MPGLLSEKKYLSLSAIARASNLSAVKLIEHCRRGHLDALEVDGDWFVNKIELDRCQQLGEPDEPVNFHHPLLRPLGYLTIVLLLIFSLQANTLSKTWTYLSAGERVVTEIAVSTITPKLSPDQNVQPANVLTSAGDNLARFWLTLDNFWETLGLNFRYFATKTSVAWKNFLNPSGSVPELAGANLDLTLNAAVVEKLKSEIKAELEKELLIQAIGENLPDTGLVVLPSSGDPVRDAALAQDLAEVFSDQVEIRFDVDGRSGVITPLFRGRTGEKYIFIITPITPKKP